MVIIRIPSVPLLFNISNINVSFDKVSKRNECLSSHNYLLVNKKIVNPLVQKYLPFINFIIGTIALGFQVTVLYPWHYELQQEFNELQKQQEAKLLQYHELKMQTIKNIEENLTKLRKEKKSDVSKKSTETI
jgi:hypothetical protein